MKNMPSVQTSRNTPTTQVSSRGYLYAPCRKTCVMCTSTITTMPEPA